MKINCLFLAFFFLFSCLLFSQTDVKIKNGSSNILLQINDEGAAGSLTLPSLTTIGSPAGKLYNFGNSLYWSGVPLAYNRSHYFSAFLTSTLALTSNTETNLTNFTEFFDSDNGVQNTGIFDPATGILTIPFSSVYHFDISTTWRVQNNEANSIKNADVPISVIIKREYIGHGGPSYNYFKFNHFVHLTNMEPGDIFGKDNFDESVVFSTNIKAGLGDKFTFYVWYENTNIIELIGGGSSSTTISAFTIN